jgi:hypothetical protein
VPFEKSRATEFWLRVEQSALTVWEKSAEGIVAGANEMARAARGTIATSDSPRSRPERCPVRMGRVNENGK